MPSFVHRPLAGRTLARYDVFISYDGDDLQLASELYTRLTERGLMPYLDVRDVRPDVWSPRIAHAIDQSRSFAILVGRTFRKDRYQVREIAVASEDAARDRLPFHIFVLDDHLPELFHDEIVIKIGRDVRAIADRIVRGFQHPVEIRAADAAPLTAR